MDEAARVRVGASTGITEELLHVLAQDRSIMVRAAVAMNSGLAIPTAHMLARDADERVRELIARKLGALAPGLGPHEHEALRRETYAALTILVADETIRVRAALAELLKEMPDAPRELILVLANDVSDRVAEPVISLSPLLTEEDLLALLEAQPAKATALAVARRPDLTEKVCDAVALTASVEAISALLANPAATIRETTLDALIARAAEHVDWHEPLVRRPALTAASARKLSEIVATHLLEQLAQRSDLPVAVTAELGRRLAERLRSPRSENVVYSWSERAPSRSIEAQLLQAAQRGDTSTIVRLLAAEARVAPAIIQRAASLRSAKGVVSLIWKAGLSMRVAGPLQSLLARVGPSELMAPDADGNFPLTREEMRWQIDFLERTGR